MKEALFLGACTGIGKNSGKPYYVVFLGNNIDNGVGISCWSPLFVNEEEYSDFVKLKPMIKVKVEITRGDLKSYDIRKEKVCI